MDDRRTGREPVAAKSSMRLRVVLSVAAVVVGLGAAGGFWLATPEDRRGEPLSLVVVGICLLVVLIALMDIMVLVRKLRS